MSFILDFLYILVISIIIEILIMRYINEQNAKIKMEKRKLEYFLKDEDVKRGLDNIDMNEVDKFLDEEENKRRKQKWKRSTTYSAAWSLTTQS